MKAALDRVFMPLPGLLEHVTLLHYHLVTSQGQIVLPQVWEDLVKPNWAVFVELWPGLDLTNVTEWSMPAWSMPALASRIYDSLENDGVQDTNRFETDDRVIYFRHAVGRKFTFPFYKVETWKVKKNGSENSIQRLTLK
jgi:hypothetical protein